MVPLKCCEVIGLQLIKINEKKNNKTLYLKELEKEQTIQVNNKCQTGNNETASLSSSSYQGLLQSKSFKF